MKTTKTTKVIAGILSVAMMVCMLLSMTVGVSAVEVNEEVMDAKQGIVQIQVWFVDSEADVSAYLSYGTGFLINEDTVVTCDHVATGFPDSWYTEWTRETNARYGLKRTVEEVKSMLELRVTVDRDVWVRATVRKASAEMDFAILTLEEKIHNREILPLRPSNTLKQTEAVYALGFPGDMDDIKEEHTYGVNEVAVSSGNVNQVAKMSFVSGGMFEDKYFDNVEFVEHSALITGGNSGGPLVDANGAVVGVNSASSSTRNLAIGIDQVISTLDALGIEYTLYDSTPGVSPKPDTKPSDVTEQEEPEDVKQTEKAEESEKEEKEEEAKEGFFDNTTNIIIVVAAGVVLLLVIIIIIVVAGGKKKKAPAAVVAPAAPRPATPPAGYTGPVSGGFTAPPIRTPGPAVVTTPPTAAAGETTVLNEGAGETTVLSKKINGGTLVRKKTGETVSISSEHFVIGRERKNVNYCISDNTSISRSHAKLIVKNGATYLVDMGAANGTYVNGVKAEPRHEVQLKNGDKITLADEDLEFRI